ncbi:Heat stress transcription factor [Seminavis robusta]|uniref:Heat stress transcription factor n=1 Tax=Seminavis robusta TaxID=568900 RepID=A0A9N8DQD0_9STRA|nr:Heat stress transcription factor [Seminavis robusta]|eukprot:Sro183_g079690.1 Heat stress transcription factor (493) ;mRNA; r:57885-59572
MAPNNKAVDETPPDVPLFLRKTYHMIDSCDPTIACWSDDGETFIVKDPSKFEATIIPQFFKHSKFTSFVRQLNFYSFRKIKYMDTLRLDPKLEAQTANYWRFKHDKFQRGKPHLLSEIKRMTGSKGGPAANKTPPAPVTSANGAGSEAMKSELDSLKKRIEEMNKNMTQLTSMVQKVTLSSSSKDEEEEAASKPPAASVVKQDGSVPHVPVGSKRKKLDTSLPESVPSLAQAAVSVAPPQPILPPDVVGSLDDTALIVRPDEMLSSNVDFEEILPMDLGGDEQVQLQPLDTSAQPVDTLYDFSKDLNGDDVALVDVCQNGDSADAVEDSTATHLLPDPSTGLPPTAFELASRSRPNRADPELMDRLSEALAVLPKAMQEQIVERLIAAITTTDLYTAPMPANVVPAGQQGESSAMEDDKSVASKDDQEKSSPAAVGEIGMPLAAATLAALLGHYSEQVKKQRSSSPSSSCSANKSKASRTGVKDIPVIPVHA